MEKKKKWRVPSIFCKVWLSVRRRIFKWGIGKDPDRIEIILDDINFKDCSNFVDVAAILTPVNSRGYYDNTDIDPFEAPKYTVDYNVFDEKKSIMIEPNVIIPVDADVEGVAVYTWDYYKKQRDRKVYAGDVNILKPSKR